MCKIPVWSIKPLTCLFCETQHAIHCKHIIQAAQYLYVLNIWIINKPVVIRCLCCNPNSNICIISRTAFSVVHFCFTRTTQYLFWDFFFQRFIVIHIRIFLFHFVQFHWKLNDKSQVNIYNHAWHQDSFWYLHWSCIIIFSSNSGDSMNCFNRSACSFSRSNFIRRFAFLRSLASILWIPDILKQDNFSAMQTKSWFRHSFYQFIVSARNQTTKSVGHIERSDETGKLDVGYEFHNAFAYCSGPTRSKPIKIAMKKSREKNCPRGRGNDADTGGTYTQVWKSKLPVSKYLDRNKQVKKIYWLASSNWLF